MSVKEELNKPELIPSKWNRNTVADGTWLQKHTLDKLKERDDFLASAIDNLSGNTDDSLSGLSAAIDYVSGSYSSFYTNEYLQFKEDVESSAAQFDTDLQKEINDRIEKDDYHDEAIETIKQQIDTMNAATDVVDVWGTYSAFSAEWRDTYFPGGSALITNNDIIKIINDEYTEIEDNLTTGHQTYFRWVCNDPVPSGPDDGQWEYIGYTDPYYNRTEVDDKILGIENTIIDLSGTVADNYLSANTDAVKQGHNIKVTKQTGPVIEIATKDNVDFTELSADTAWVDTISANVSAFDFYETTSGKRLSETQQGLFINTTDSPFDPTKSASEGDIFWPANFEQIFSAWYDTDKLINIKYTNDNITRLYTLHNVRQYTEGDFTYYDLNFISNDDKVAYTAYAKVKRNGGEGGGAPTAPVLYECDEGPIDVEYTGEHGVYVSGDHKVGLSSTYETALKEGSAASAYITSHSGDFLNSAHNAYNKLTFNFGTTTKDYQANSSAYSFTFNAGNAINFITGADQITISSNDTTYQGSTYISTANNIISVTGDLIGSAESGNLAWKALTDAKWKADTTTMGDVSAGFTLSAGTGVGFNKNYTDHILTITAEGTTYNAGSYISTANKTISVTGTLINSAQSGQSAYNWITTKSATLSAGPGIGFVSAGPNILGISAEGTKVSAGGNIQDPTEYTTNVNLCACGGVQFVTANNNVLGIKTSTMEYSPFNYSTYSDMDSFKINAVALQGSQQYESVVIVNDRVYGFLLPDPDSTDQLKIPVARYVNGRGYYVLDPVTAAVGNYVSAANQQRITVATATTLPSPASMENGVYYIV